MIELCDLEFRYGQSSFALQIGQLRLQDTEHVALIGPSGCGKTTLLNILAGVVLPHTGSVQVAGESVAQLSDAKRRAFRIHHLGLVFQNFELLNYLTVRDNILLPLRVGRGLSVTTPLRQRAEDLAARLDIVDKLDRHPPQLSQGERQRVAVSRALLLQPSVILADEPTGNLDPANKFVVLDLLLDHARESGATLLTVTHDRELLDRFDRVVDFSELNSWRSE
jgi:putative ABC transport system ATP-binding protein